MTRIKFVTDSKMLHSGDCAVVYRDEMHHIKQAAACKDATIIYFCIPYSATIIGYKQEF